MPPEAGAARRTAQSGRGPADDLYAMPLATRVTERRTPTSAVCSPESEAWQGSTRIGRPHVSNIYEVAKRAGVSTATVSRVLSQPSVVSPATRRKVRQAVARLGYAPNSTAKNLRTLRTAKLLVAVPDISNPFFSLIMQGIEDAAQRAGYSVLLGDTQNDASREERYALMLKHKEADGLIFFSDRLPRAAAALMRSMAPRCAPVVKSACTDRPQLAVPSVQIDNAKAAAEAMDHLYGLGHRRLGIVTGPLAGSISRERLRGATARARADKTERELRVKNGDFSIESGIKAADRLLARRKRPTAIFCFNDEMAIGVIEAARRHGLRVPHDLSVVGFDDIRFARHIDPPLTTIAQPMREIGARTVRLLLEILSGAGGGAAPASVTLPHKLVVRSSTAPATDA